MPKKSLSESVLHDWVHELPFQQQALLMTAMRGPDGSAKHNHAKVIVRFLRGAICKPAGNWSGYNDNDFMWGDYTVFKHCDKAFWDDHDEYAHHFIMHLVHSAQVIAYKHPVNEVAYCWLTFYSHACEAFHMRHETKSQMDARLSDFGVGVHNIQAI
jgi:hypothetical protein